MRPGAKTLHCATSPHLRPPPPQPAHKPLSMAKTAQIDRPVPPQQAVVLLFLAHRLQSSFSFLWQEFLSLLFCWRNCSSLSFLSVAVVSVLSSLSSSCGKFFLQFNSSFLLLRHQLFILFSIVGKYSFPFLSVPSEAKLSSPHFSVEKVPFPCWGKLLFVLSLCKTVLFPCCGNSLFLRSFYGNSFLNLLFSDSSSFYYIVFKHLFNSLSVIVVHYPQPE
jgi:hypothetical protein